MPSTRTEIQAEVQDDFDVFDGVEIVTVRLRGAGDTFTDVPNITALRRARSAADVAAQGGSIVSPSLTWHIKAISTGGLVGHTLRPHDKILDAAGVTWTLLEVSLNVWGTRWQGRAAQAVA